MSITYPPELLPMADDEAEVFVCCDADADHSNGPCPLCECAEPAKGASDAQP
jgi:hypothetical protein